MSLLSLVGCDSPEAQEWDRRVAREVALQARIEAAFDRVDAFARIGDSERALACLDEAEALSGGLSPAYRATRARLAWDVARRHQAGAR